MSSAWWGSRRIPSGPKSGSRGSKYPLKRENCFLNKKRKSIFFYLKRGDVLPRRLRRHPGSQIAAVAGEHEEAAQAVGRPGQPTGFPINWIKIKIQIDYTSTPLIASPSWGLSPSAGTLRRRPQQNRRRIPCPKTRCVVAGTWKRTHTHFFVRHKLANKKIWSSHFPHSPHSPHSVQPKLCLRSASSSLHKIKNKKIFLGAAPVV